MYSIAFSTIVRCAEFAPFAFAAVVLVPIVVTLARHAHRSDDGNQQPKSGAA